MAQEVSTIIGELIHEAFFKDESIREKIRPINQILSEVSARKFKVDLKLPMPIDGSFNNYIVSSYHAAKSVELLIDTARKAFKSRQSEVMPALITIQHSFGLEAVVNLNSSRLFLTNHLVLNALGFDSPKLLEEVYSKRFPRLHEVRNAFVHDDERVLGLVWGKSIGGGIETLQFIQQDGNRIKVKDRDGADLLFEFHPAIYLNLLDDLLQVLERR